jgi:hypothetical protein
MAISDTDIAKYARQAGFNGQALVTAVAIALAESGGNPNAINDGSKRGTAEYSVGLWQINVGGYLRERLARWGLTTPSQLTNPSINAKAAYSISNGGKNWTPWSVYNHNSYQRYLPRAQAAVAAIGSDPSMPDNVERTDADKAKAILNWWNTNPFSHNAASSWIGIINDLKNTDPEAATYLASIIKQLNLDPTVALGPFDASSGPAVLAALAEAGGVSTTYTAPSDDAGIFGPIFAYLNQFVSPLAHGFYFLVFIIIGLVILVIAFKAQRVVEAPA